MFNRDMGLCSAGFVDGGLVFGMSMILACFMGAGTYPVVQIFWIRFTVIYSAMFPAPYRSSAVILSGPADFFLFSLLRAAIIVGASGGFVMSAMGG